LKARRGVGVMAGVGDELKRTLFVICLFFVVATAAQAQRINFGFGFSAGVDMPVQQPEQRTGSMFGFRLRIKTLPSVGLEPCIYFSRFGVPKSAELSTGTNEGLRVTAYGLDITLGAKVGGTGFKPYGLVGAGYYNTKQNQELPGRKDFGASAGVGLEIGITPVVALDVRSKLVAVAVDGHYRKSTSVVGGFNYYFGN
jgi:hypothetical protein